MAPSHRADGVGYSRTVDVNEDLTDDAARNDDDEQLEFLCPRCDQEVAARFYGPCASCRTQLRANLSGESRDVEAPDYEPKMNVTPNAVATKD